MSGRQRRTHTLLCLLMCLSFLVFPGLALAQEANDDDEVDLLGAILTAVLIGVMTSDDDGSIGEQQPVEDTSDDFEDDPSVYYQLLLLGLGNYGGEENQANEDNSLPSSHYHNPFSKTHIYTDGKTVRYYPNPDQYDGAFLYISGD